MSLIAVTDADEIRRACEKMASKLRPNTTACNCEIGYQEGTRNCKVRWNASKEFWWMIDGKALPNRWWCCYGILDPHSNPRMHPIVQTNIPLQGINKRISAVFAENEFGDIFLAHSGKIGGGLEGVGKDNFLEFYGAERLHPIHFSNKTLNDYIIISSINDDNLVEHISCFVHEVASFKQPFREDCSQSNSVENLCYYSFNPEFEGVRECYSLVGVRQAVCNHGMVVKHLHEALQHKGINSYNDCNRDLYIHDGKKVTHLFEVKTGISTAEIYTGVGQLMVYGARSEVLPQRRVLVLPEAVGKKMYNALARLGLDILVYDLKGNVVAFPDLDKLL